ncbi:Ubiquinol-cytochrome c chaperone-UPF0174 [Babesia duncani]|uniref:Ubiquinol-cytochrome c chaperone-UPF0174 n=1 Tax=Babesia duncani TaxID=323732 RepID=A0AAD9UP85_9APIC|nr:Ubiquinol-cytochrome c chaperone-UPF0174 [Babesia duncani]
MLRFITRLDRCTLDMESYPFKISQVLEHEMYENEVDEDTLKLIVKYTIRQFVHISNLGSKEFLDGMFLWADVEEICPPSRLLKKPMAELITYDGYKPTPEQVKEIETPSKKSLKA